MFFRGPLAELVAMVDLKLYHKHFTYDSKGVELLYFKMNKALCGFFKGFFCYVII